MSPDQEKTSEPPSPLHPLRPLTSEEVLRARTVVVEKVSGKDVLLYFRSIYLDEPKRDDLVQFLLAEHGGQAPVNTPPRQATVLFDRVEDGVTQLMEAIVDVEAGEIRRHKTFPAYCQTSYTATEFGHFQDICVASEMFKKAMEEFSLPEEFAITIDPWPYGGLDPDEDVPRYMQGLVYARNVTSDNPDSNHYAYPLPIIPVMDMKTKELIRIDRLATGGVGDSLYPSAPTGEPRKLFGHGKSAEYIPELLDRPIRTDLKPIDITQPEGASFKVHSDNLVEWQKWRFRLGFNPREGAVLHDVCYDGRPVLFRLSFSEMTVPYGDPRPPFHRKQAFDFGDGGIGRAANNLKLGCDCLGAIHYVSAVVTTPGGEPDVAENVVCMHEQDNGIGWKHTNFRTNRAVVTRLREFVVQFVGTLANYEYVFAYKLDTAGGITVEVRATGIVSVVPIDDGKVSGYGNVVFPGVLAQNHQHIFAVRIDPSIDSYDGNDTAVVLEENHPIPMNPETNPFGNGYEIRRRVVESAMYEDAEPRLNRAVKMENVHKKNAISGKNVGYKFTPNATQLMLADDNSTQAARAPYAKHHLWVTGYRDEELWAAGEFTNQSKKEEGGVRDMVARGDWFVDTPSVTSEKGQRSSPVVWNVFGLTHNPRVEDWPVMPVEIHQFHIRPADFFTSNPALDMPTRQNESSVIVPCCGKDASRDGKKSGVVQADPLAHQQGPAVDIDPKELGKGPEASDNKRHSGTLSKLFAWKKDSK
ncbi:putative copper amine oxidase [Rosellinia necatrix]|uniref:Amine oxidase n=1 Tax=Rosellinia necatrix TaxID=77044 RepID=A0A1W2TP95_ROSNE|nr:putative copper amine oxidase [Rosellinia necatrix]